MQGHSFQLLDQSFGIGPTYVITLGPGAVRYLRVMDFLNANVEEVITYLCGQCEKPEFRSDSNDIDLKELTGVTQPRMEWDRKLELRKLDLFLDGKPWDTKMRVHHTLGRMFLSDGLPSWV